MEIRSIEYMESACAGCSLCSAVCPTQAIKMTGDQEGFLQPIIDYQKCINCGRCLEECILNAPAPHKKMVQKVYAAYSLDSDVRYNSTSGGIFTELAMVVLEELGGVVVGAVYQDDFSVKHEVIYDVEDIPRLRQSKYIQSNMEDMYKAVDNVAEDIMIMFVGTPCQIAAFYQYMKKRNNPVVYVDFICRGVNSPDVFQHYLKELEQENESKITNVWFKNKEEGWNQFQTRIEFENGKVYRNDRYKDAFMRGFLKHNLYMRNSCYECQFKGAERIADITLADFWGIKLQNKELDIEKGVSAVLLHSDVGEKLFSMIKEKVYYEENNLENVRNGNGCIDVSVKKGERRDEFYSRLKQECFSKIILSMEE